MLIYEGLYQTAPTRFENRFEMFNEWMITCVSLTVVFYNDWIPDLEVQENYGWVTCILVGFTVVINILCVIYQLYKFLKLVFIKYGRRIIRSIKTWIKKRNPSVSTAAIKAIL